jgi:hypothetical protein
VGFVLLVTAVVLNRDRPVAIAGDESVLLAVAIASIVPMLLGLVLVGALIASRRPHNPIGWLLMAGGLQFIVAAVAQGYAHRALAIGRELPAAAIANWVGGWLPVAAYVGAGFVFLLFPDGRLPSARWRWFGWSLALLGAAYTAAFAAEGWSSRHVAPGELERAVPYLAGTSMAALWPVYMGLLAVPIAALVVRYRRGAPDERAQIRWLVPAGAAIALGPVLYYVGDGSMLLVGILSGLGGLGLPVAIAVAVLRYRLYAIDRIIRRTVTYGLVVAVLGGVYVAGVVALGAVAAGVTGARGSDLVVAASTLAAVAVFRPVRSRVQGVVDRRFDRTGHAARQAVDSFGERLRDEVHVAAIEGETARTAARALKPAFASVWLVEDRVPADPRGGSDEAVTGGVRSASRRPQRH